MSIKKRRFEALRIALLVKALVFLEVKPPIIHTELNI